MKIILNILSFYGFMESDFYSGSQRHHQRIIVESVVYQWRMDIWIKQCFTLKVRNYKKFRFLFDPFKGPLLPLKSRPKEIVWFFNFTFDQNRIIQFGNYFGCEKLLKNQKVK